MITAAIRTIILYLLIILGIRLMGKRQLAQLQPYEVVITLMISDLATQPMGDVEMPLLGGVVRAVFQLVWVALTVLDLVVRVKMMLHAYAGEAYVLPLIGEHARTFE